MITHFVDLESSSAAFIDIRRMDDGLAIGFGVEANGDLDLYVSDADARKIADAILAGLKRGGGGMERSDLLNKMASHVRYEVDKMIDFLAIGNHWTGVLRPDIGRLTQESILEAALIHTRCVAEFLRRSNGEDTNEPSRSVIVARDYVPTWHWNEGEPLKAPLAQFHGRVAHLGVIRAPVENEGDFRWNEFIVLHDKPIPIILGGFRLFLGALARIDTDRHALFNAPHVGFPDMTMEELISSIIDT
jgi:hypothetical protein